MITRFFAVLGMTLVLAGCGLAGSSTPGKADTAASSVDPFSEAPPRASCGPGSVQEEDLQGQVSKIRRQIGFTGYSCNLALVGQFKGEGTSWQHSSYRDCSYYDTKNDPSQENPGSVVVDVRDPAHPVASAYLQDDALVDPWESLKVHATRGLLAGVRGDNGGDGGTGGPQFSVYDIKQDCAHPRLVATTEFDGFTGHEGNFNQDGTLYYGSGGAAAASGGGTAYAIDLVDPAKPRLIGSITPSGHGLSFSADGTRGYLVTTGVSVERDAANGLLIYDTTEFEQRKPNPVATLLGTVTWTDGRIAQHTIPVTYDGHPYVIFVDEGVYGAARIIDVEKDEAPVVISKLKLEIHLEENRSEAQADGAVGIINYDGHYCSVDRLENPTAVACGYAWSGIRVFDIRDPYRPKEIAYYVPDGTTLPGAGSQVAGGSLSGPGIDVCTSQSQFVPERGELWVTCQANGFMVLKFTNGVWPFAE